MADEYLVLCFLAPILSSYASSTPSTFPAPEDLRTEYLNSPLGIDTTKPRFSWKVIDNNASQRRNQQQAAYQIQVFNGWLVGTNESREVGEMVWDSGKTISTDFMNIEYKGKVLQTGIIYLWKVRWWERFSSDDQPSPYSELGVFSVGVPNDEWVAQWIGRPHSAAHRMKNGFTRPLQLRTEFELDTTDVRQTILYVSGLGYYQVYVNGYRVDNKTLGPFTSYYKRVLYDAYSLLPWLGNGRNAIGARLAPGFWGNDYNGPLMFRLQMHVEFKNGSAVKLVSQAGHTNETSVIHTHWKTHDDPCTQAHVYEGEHYDARQEEDGWNEPGFDDSHWNTAAEVANSGAGDMHGRMMEPIRKSTNLTPVRMTEPMPGVFVFDFGQNFAGVVRLTVKGPAGTVVTMYKGELLYPNGTVNNQLHVNMTTVYTLRGGEEEVYEPSFVVYGFQYVQVTGYPGKPTLESVEGIFIHSNVAPVGSLEFRQGDRVDILRDVQHAIQWSQQSNLMSTPTDCPNREKRGWMGDAQVTALVAIWNFDMAAFYQSWIMSMRDEQELFGTGVVPDIVPSGGKGNPNARTDASWSSAYTLISLYVYQHYGNKRLIEELYDGYKAYVDNLGSIADSKTGLLIYHKYGDWCNTYPRTEEIPTTGPISASFHYIVDLEILSYFASLTGHRNDAEEYQNKANVLKLAFHKYYYNETVTGYVNGTQTQNVLPLYGDFVPEHLVDQVTKSFIHDIVTSNHMHLTTGAVGTRFLLPTLTKLGRTDIALALSTQTTEPSWGYWITQNATSLWEDWSGVADPTHPPPPTHNHIFLGSHGSWLYETLGGIGQNQTSIAFRHIIIRPPQATLSAAAWDEMCHEDEHAVFNLDEVAATHASLRGVISVEWRQSPFSNAFFNVNTTVPINSHASVWIPARVSCKVPPASSLTVMESAKTVWTKGQFVAGQVGVLEGRFDEDLYATVFTVGSGQYNFTISAW